MNRADINVAVIGLGVGEQHARAWASLPGFRVRWVCDLDRGRIESTIAAIGQGSAASSFGEVLSDPQTDVVSIATFDQQHAEQALAALRAKKHVFCEKPLCRSSAELRMLAEAWRTSGCALKSNLVLRAAPAFQWLGNAIRGGELGQLYAFDGEYLYGRLTKITEGWRSQEDSYSVTLGGGVHLVDLLLVLTGERPTTVSAVGNRLSSEGTAFRYDDFVAATLLFPSGMVGRIASNFGCVHRHQHVVRVFGTKATFLSDDQGPRLHVSRDPGEAPRRLEQSPLPATKGDLIPAFARSIRDRADTTDETRHEFDVIAVCLGIDRALESGETQRIEYL